MRKKADNEPSLEQIRNMKFSEERFQLLDTIRDMVSDEFDRRKLIEEESCLHLKNTIHEPVELKATENKPVHRILWQRLVNIFNIDSYSNIHSSFHNKDKKAT